MWLEALDARGILDRVYILAGVTPIRSLKMALHLHHKIPGVTVPDEILKRFREADEGSYEKIGIEIALRIIDEIKGKKGINGLHLMSVGWESVVPEIIRQSGLYTSKETLIN